MATPVVTRFAPSPTGHLHIGGVRTALFCWAYARGHGGRFVLRIEDTDQKRSTTDAARGILEDLAWVGVPWDDGPEHVEKDHRVGGDPRGVGPFYQSQRLKIYARAIDRLIEGRRAYPCFETPEELDALRRDAASRKETFRYRRRPGDDHDAGVARMRAGEPCVVRFRMPDEAVRVVDDILGEIEFTEEHLEDFVVRKADGFPTYHFAVVVDDELMGVTHVLRGQEHLNNTPKHVALQRALTRDDGTPYRTPVYAHLPLIFNPDGSKMSKRDKDKALKAALVARGLWEHAESPREEDRPAWEAWLKDPKVSPLPSHVAKLSARALGLTLPEIDVEDFRQSGYLPEAICNYLALLGWNPGLKNPDGTDLERFDNTFLAGHFTLERVGKTNSKFDREKLLAFNQDAIARLAPAEFDARWREWCDRYDRELPALLGARFALAARAVQPRIKTLSQGREPIGFAIVDASAIRHDPAAVEKVLRKGEPSGLAVLAELRVRIADLEAFDPGTIENAIKTFCEGRSLGMGRAAQPLRVALTGSTVSPGLGETLALVGREGAIARIDRCLRELGR